MEPKWQCNKGGDLKRPGVSIDSLLPQKQGPPFRFDWVESDFLSLKCGMGLAGDSCATTVDDSVMLVGLWKKAFHFHMAFFEK